MSFIIKAKQYTPAPVGVWNAVLVDCIDRGVRITKFGERDRVQLVWELEALMESGERFTASRSYNVSIDDKSALKKDLLSWRGGRAFTQAELDAFDLETFLGVSCKLIISPEIRDGKTYSNIANVMPADEAQRLTPSGRYVRVKDRAERKTNVSTVGEDSDTPEITPPPATPTVAAVAPPQPKVESLSEAQKVEIIAKYLASQGKVGASA